MSDTRDDKLDDRLVYTQDDLRALGVDYSFTHLYNMIRKGKFPQTISPKGHKLMWRASDIHAWIAQRQAERSRPRLKLVPKASPPPEPKKATNVWLGLGEVTAIYVESRAVWKHLLARRPLPEPALPRRRR